MVFDTFRENKCRRPANVRFATRSFIDGFYNTFIKNTGSLPFKADIVNVPSDIMPMPSAVGRTQVRTNTVAPTFKVRSGALL